MVLVSIMIIDILYTKNTSEVIKTLLSAHLLSPVSHIKSDIFSQSRSSSLRFSIINVLNH